MKTLIIAEKQDFAKSIAKVLHICDKDKSKGYYENDKYILTWLVGHLYPIKEPHEHKSYEHLKEWKLDTLPFFIPRLEYKTDTDKTKLKQHIVISKILKRKDIGEIINACDPEIEGTLIFFITLIYNKIPIDKVKIKRLWATSTETNGLIKAFNNLRTKEYDINLYKAGMVRQSIDMHIGLNMTRLYSILVGAKTRLGRVKMAIINELVNREKEIENFKPQPYWELVINTNKDIQCKWFTYESEQHIDRFTRQEKAETYKDYISKNKTGKVLEISKKKEKRNAPLLYSIDELYKDASKYFNYKHHHTLEIAEKLYLYGYITYPRTSSSHLNRTSFNEVKEILLEYKNDKEYGKYLINLNVDNLKPVKRIFNDNAVEGHEAIIPTRNIPTNLEKDLKNIYDLIVKRFIANFLPPMEYETTKIICGFGENQEQTFKTIGRKILSKGYAEIYKDDNAEEDKENIITTNIKKGDMIIANEVRLDKKETAAPPRYTMSSILDYLKYVGNKIDLEDDKELMKIIKEHKIGLGTPATRAQILKEIEDNGYMVIKGKSIYVTNFAKDIVSILPEEYKKPEFTMEVQKNIYKISRGENINAINYLKQVLTELEEIIEKIKRKDINIDYSNKDTLAKCPICRNGYIKKVNDNYHCTNAECKASINTKENKLINKYNIRLTKNDIKKLLLGGQIYVKGLKNDNNITFDTVLVLRENNGYLNFEFDFDLLEKIKEEMREKSIVGKCPECLSYVRETQNGFKCDGYMNKCKFYLSKNDKLLSKYNKKLTRGTVKLLLKNNKATIKNMKNNKPATITLFKQENGYYGWKFL